MKKIIVLFLLVLCQLFTYAQEIQQKNVPAVVLNVFQLKFPNATDTRWKLETGNYHVRFKLNNKANELVINDKGSIIKYQRDLYLSEIPPVILEAIKSKVSLFDVSDADRIEENGKTVFIVSSEINGKDHEFTIDEKGSVLKHRQELRKSEIPVPVLNSVMTAYNGFEIHDAVRTEESGKVLYNIELSKSKTKVTVILNPEGKILEVKNR